MADNSTGHLGDLDEATVVDFGDKGPGRKFLTGYAHLDEVAAHLLGRERHPELAFAAGFLIDAGTDLTF